MPKNHCFLLLAIAGCVFSTRLAAQQANMTLLRPQNTGLRAYRPARNWQGLDLPLFLGTANTVTGTQALNSCSSCYQNVADGYQALFSCTTCNTNVAVGFQALYGVTSGGGNTAVGWAALNVSTASGNSAFGSAALESNTTGTNNTAVGNGAMAGGTGSNNTAVGSLAFANEFTENYGTAVGAGAMSESHSTTGYNVALGYDALFGYVVQGQGSGNTGSFNLAAGPNAMKNNSNGTDNVGLGYCALYQNGAGNLNTSSGVLSMYANSTGSDNVGDGFASLYYNTTGIGNTAVGLEALLTNATGNYNTALGQYANTASGALTNSMALGANSTVSSSNAVVIGSSSVTSIGGYANWTNFSDGRYKRNIQQNVPGLAFVRRLNPVTYTLDIAGIEAKLQGGRRTVTVEGSTTVGTHASPSAADPVMKQAMQEKTAITYTGFVAQEVEKVADSMGYVFSGVDKPKDINQSFYGLRYADFIPPLVKAVQELAAGSDKKDSVIAALEGRYDSLQAQLNELRAMVMERRGAVSNASLEQNAPNPFSGSTVIGYSLPKGVSSAQMQITDVMGKVLAVIPLSSGDGKNTIRADVSGYASGTYSYTLIVDGKVVGTKQMISVR